MNQFEQMLGNPQTQQEFQDFANRYQQGDPTQGYSGQEAMQRFQQVAPQLPAQEFQQAASQTFQQWSPQQRQQFGQYITQQAQQQNVNVGQTGQAASGDPNALAQMVTQVHQQQPGLLPQLLGAASGAMGGSAPSGGQGGPGGQLAALESNPLAKAALAGIAAMAAQRILSRR